VQLSPIVADSSSAHRSYNPGLCCFAVRSGCCLPPANLGPLDLFPASFPSGFRLGAHRNGDFTPPHRGMLTPSF